MALIQSHFVLTRRGKSLISSLRRILLRARGEDTVCKLGGEERKRERKKERKGERG